MWTIYTILFSRRDDSIPVGDKSPVACSGDFDQHHRRQRPSARSLEDKRLTPGRIFRRARINAVRRGWNNWNEKNGNKKTAQDKETGDSEKR